MLPQGRENMKGRQLGFVTAGLHIIVKLLPLVCWALSLFWFKADVKGKGNLLVGVWAQSTTEDYVTSGLNAEGTAKTWSKVAGKECCYLWQNFNAELLSFPFKNMALGLPLFPSWFNDLRAQPPMSITWLHHSNTSPALHYHTYFTEPAVTLISVSGYKFCNILLSRFTNSFSVRTTERLWVLR